MIFQLKKLTYSAVLLAAALLLPFLTGNNRELGNMLCLMHIPVLLCGFVCGPVWGGVVGFCAPLLRHLIVGMPPLLTALPMAFELCAYAVFAGLLYRLLPKKLPFTYVSLVGAMLLGRVVWGVAKYLVLLSGLNKSGAVFGLGAFWAEGFVTALAGMALQIVLIPLIVTALDKAKLLPQKEQKQK